MHTIEEGKYNLDYYMLIFWRFKTFFLKYNTFKKFKNYCLIKLQKKFRTLKVRGYPYELLIDPSSICNLRCPGCLAHSKDFSHNFLSFEKFKNIIDRKKSYLYNIEMYGWGEPFLNKEIYKMIKYAKKNRIFVRISSHFNNISYQNVDEIIDSGLDFIILSIDGASQETYQKYRRNGDFNKVMKNVKSLIYRKKKMSKNTPFLEWQFIVNSYNEHEMEKVKRMAEDLGIDRLRFMSFSPIHINEDNNKEEAEKWLPKNKKYRQWEDSLNPKGYVFSTNCGYLWESLTIGSKGQINLCPNRIGSQVDCGEVDDENFWNKDIFTKPRKLFQKEKLETRIPCSGCREFRQRSIK
jgi:radical SAM protein with 4Fe4S-binding SPASM domain